MNQAETQQKSADGAVTARLPETYQWLLVPVQDGPKAPVKWDAMRLTGQEPLAVRASRKLRAVDLLFVSMSGTRLLMELNRIPLWRGDAVSVRQRAEDFGKYVYLPRLKDSHVLAGAIADGVQLLTWEQDSFAFADRYDEEARRYRGLRGGLIVSVSGNSLDGVLVKSDVAAQQTADEQKPEQLPDQPTPPGQPGQKATEGEPAPGIARSAPVLPKRYHGSATLDPTRVGLAASKVADEVIAHLVGLVGARVTVTLEIEASVPAGVPEKVVRIVTENGRTLKFDSQGFEPD